MASADERSPDDGWIALPGLFEDSEVVGDEGLELRAMPLVLVQGRTFYVVYARERPVRTERERRRAA